MWAWALCWLLSWPKGRGRAKVWEVFEGDSMYGSVAGQLGQAAIWFPSPWRENLLQAWQRLLWCVIVVIPFQLYSDICWTILKQCGQWPVCIVRWPLQVTACCEAQIKNLEGIKHRLCSPTHSPPIPFPFPPCFSCFWNVMCCFSFPCLPVLPTAFLCVPSTLTFPTVPCLGAFLTHWGNQFKSGVF